MEIVGDYSSVAQTVDPTLFLTMSDKSTSVKETLALTSMNQFPHFRSDMPHCILTQPVKPMSTECVSPALLFSLVTYWQQRLRPGRLGPWTRLNPKDLHSDSHVLWWGINLYNEIIL